MHCGGILDRGTSGLLQRPAAVSASHGRRIRAQDKRLSSAGEIGRGVDIPYDAGVITIEHFQRAGLRTQKIARPGIAAECRERMAIAAREADGMRPLATSSA